MLGMSSDQYRYPKTITYKRLYNHMLKTIAPDDGCSVIDQARFEDLTKNLQQLACDYLDSDLVEDFNVAVKNVQSEKINPPELDFSV